MLFWYSSTLQFHVCNFSNSFGRLGEWNVEVSSNPKPPQSVTLQTQSCASNREFKTLFSHFTSDQRKCGMLALALNFNQFNSKYMKSKCISRTSEGVTSASHLLPCPGKAGSYFVCFKSLFEVHPWGSSSGLAFIPCHIWNSLLISHENQGQKNKCGLWWKRVRIMLLRKEAKSEFSPRVWNQTLKDIVDICWQKYLLLSIYCMCHFRTSC